MRTHISSLGLCLSLLATSALGACGPHGPGDKPVASSEAKTQAAVPERPAHAGTPKARPALPTFDSTLVTSYNASLIVKDPALDMAELERVLHSVGAKITYSSANATNASVNASVPTENFDAFTRAMREVSVKVQSENRSSNDIGHELRRLTARRVSLDEAHTSLEPAGAGTRGMSPDASAIVHELLVGERQSTEQQISNYEGQLRGVNVSVSMTRAQ